MDIIIIFIMIIFGGLFAGGVLTIAWDRLPAWRDMETKAFKADFGRTIRVADRLQPILLVGTILATGVFSLDKDGIVQVLAWMAAGGFAATLAASVTILMPLQQRILSTDEPITRMYAKWRQGHIGRTVLSLVSFTLLAVSLSVLIVT